MGPAEGGVARRAPRREVARAGALHTGGLHVILDHVVSGVMRESTMVIDTHAIIDVMMSSMLWECRDARAGGREGQGKLRLAPCIAVSEGVGVQRLKRPNACIRRHVGEILAVLNHIITSMFR